MRISKGYEVYDYQIWPKIGIFGHFGPGLAASFGALLVGWLVVVARAVSRKTLVYFMTVHLKDNPFVLTALQGGLRGAVQVLFGPRINPEI